MVDEEPDAPTGRRSRRRRSSDDAADAQIGRRPLRLFLLLGEVNAPPVLRTPLSLPLTTWEAATAETADPGPGATTLVTPTSRRRPSMARRRGEGYAGPTLEAHAHAAAAFAYAAFPVATAAAAAASGSGSAPLPALSMMMTTTEKMMMRRMRDAAFSLGWRRICLLSRSLAPSVSPHSSKLH